ncbi:MAG: hypothetical protein K0S65_6091, partial [Labilithrix sp.]|nr:hypothetical protein [Labilithrix sp.]
MRLSTRALCAAWAVAGMVASTLVAVACSDRAGFVPEPKESFATPDAEAPDAGDCSWRCSRDLKTVYKDCGGTETIEATCGADEACGPGRCVDACSAAAYSKGSVGCEFWTLPPDDGRVARGSCLAAMVANTWERPITLSADYGSRALDISKSVYTVAQSDDDAKYTLLDGALPPGQIAVVFLAQAADADDITVTRCPPGTTAALPADSIRHGTSITTAFHIKADAPISAYSIYPYGGAKTAFPSATLLLPVSSWEKSYVAVSPYDFGATGFPRTLQIVAHEDDTVVSIRPNVEIPAGQGVEGTSTGKPQSWTLSRGQVLQFNQTDMTGSPISTTKPVGLFGGSECANIPGVDYCDVLHQQIPPFAQWGAEYALVPFKPRMESVSQGVREQVPYSIVG